MEWMIYGANGYTGRLIAIDSVRRGLNPILAGRNEAAVAALAAELGLKYRAFGLGDPVETRRAIKGSRLILHCAGPFVETSQPMLSACLDECVHYLDITGEIPVFENAHRQSEQARRSDVVLLPGAGFDIVPSDCLAASVVGVLPAATNLQLAFEMGGGPSPGTAKTGIEGLSKGGFIRQDGKLKRVPLAWKTRTIPFAHARRAAVTIPWGDVYTAFVSTGVPDIEVYMALPPSTIANMRRMRWLQPVLGLGMVQSFLKKQVEKKVPGPSDQVRSESNSELWAEATSADGRSVSATMTTPNGYDLTVTASLGLVEYLLQNDVEGGYYTPSLLMGADYAASLPGVEFKLLP